MDQADMLREVLRALVKAEIEPIVRKLEAMHARVRKIADQADTQQMPLPFGQPGLNAIVAAVLKELPAAQAKPRKRTRDKTIKQSVLDLINSSPDKAWTSSQIQARLKIENIGSVYQVVSELTRDRMIDRVGEGLFRAAQGDD